MLGFNVIIFINIFNFINKFPCFSLFYYYSTIIILIILIIINSEQRICSIHQTRITFFVQ